MSGPMRTTTLDSGSTGSTSPSIMVNVASKTRKERDAPETTAARSCPWTKERTRFAARTAAPPHAACILMSEANVLRFLYACEKLSMIFSIMKSIAAVVRSSAIVD